MPATIRINRIVMIVIGVGIVGVVLAGICIQIYDVDKFDGKAASDTRSDNQWQIAFVWCPAGTFSMGSPDGDPYSDSDEHPKSSVTLSHGFWIGKFEITQLQYEKVMGINPSSFRMGGPNGKELNSDVLSAGTDQFPVESMSWEDAMTFCYKLTLSERAAGRLPSNWVYTLPTEAQWEYACRATTTTRFAFGDDLSIQDANAHTFLATGRDWKLDEAALRRPAKVGSYRPNLWGIHDMHGNVSEWCRDHFQPRLIGGVDPIFEESQKNERSVRGGSYAGVKQVDQSWPFSARSANRSGNDVAVFNKKGGPAYLGFRVAICRVGNKSRLK